MLREAASRGGSGREEHVKFKQTFIFGGRGVWAPIPHLQYQNPARYVAEWVTVRTTFLFHFIISKHYEDENSNENTVPS